VRQREEDQVGVAQDVRVGGGQRQVEAGELRVHGRHRLTGLRVCRRGDQVELRVPGDQAQQLPTGVPARPGDRHPDAHTNLRMTMQRTVSTPAAGGNACHPFQRVTRNSGAGVAAAVSGARGRTLVGAQPSG
jgi:hypothetical protein